MKILIGKKNGFRGFSFVLAVLFFIFVNMTDGAKKHSAGIEPSYAQLEEGQGSLSITIYDESTVTEIQDASFFGHTSVGGIRCEVNDSNNKIDLAKIRELVVVQRGFQSKRFQDKEFTLIRIITSTGAMLDNLLVPKHVILCGIEKNTGMERSWFIEKIDKLVVEPEGTVRETPEAAVDKVFQAGQQNVFDAVTPPQKQVTPSKQEQASVEKLAAQHSQAPGLDAESKTFFGSFKRLIVDFIDMVKALWRLLVGLV